MIFDTIQSSSLRWAPLIGGLTDPHSPLSSPLKTYLSNNPNLADFSFGYYFNARIYRSHQEEWQPEYRLHCVWCAIGTMAAGLLTYGLTLHFHKHWIGLAFGCGMVVAGMIASTVSITSYALENYPDQSTVVSAIINGWQTASGFSVGYFQPAWTAKNGLALVVAILVLAITPVIVVEGRRARAKGETAVVPGRYNRYLLISPWQR
ncbi:hypothetical protein BDW75DRAFT_240776 [Aspergillus navahoensis]